MSSHKSERIFDSFTRQYALSKTLRFELKPVGKTLDNMRTHLEYDKDLQTFLVDQRIEDAYQKLKPFVDSLHEEFIADSLKSYHAKEAQFIKYVDIGLLLIEEKKTKKFRKNKEKDLGNKTSTKLDKLSDELRQVLGKAFHEAGEGWKRKYPKYKWKKGSGVAKGTDVLFSEDILTLIGDTHKGEDVQSALNEFGKSFTYLSGFNQNRKNYYETNKEAVTAIATRIVHENLPRFTSNISIFETQKGGYLEIYGFLQNLGRTLVNKNGEDVYPISEKIFARGYFNNCLSQNQIEEYNTEIGNANFLINLYNQTKTAKKQESKNLSIFKTLFKQIGCGSQDSIFFTLTHNKKADADRAREADKGKRYFSVEEILGMAKMAGEKYFIATREHELNTVPRFVEYVTKQNDYSGFYWSKSALNTISGKYFANWHDLKDRLKQAKVFGNVGRDSTEDTKIPEVIELQGFFDVLDMTPDWKKYLFKPNILNEEKEKSIESSSSAHEALLKMITDDIMFHAQCFLDGSDNILRITQDYFSSADSDDVQDSVGKRWRESVKAWMEHALMVHHMIKYFQVREGKVKDTPIDATLSQFLDVLLFSEDADWFKWYDALRNFLTKKPQDSLEENKLKLNFESSTLAGGWDVNKETTNRCVILQDQNHRQFLAVCSKSANAVFEKNITSGKGKNKIETKNPLYETQGEEEVYQKMEYNYWADASKMIPKCSTQLKDVIKHFRHSEDDFILPIGYKVASGEKFTKECRISKTVFELNNRFYKKDNLSVDKMRYDLSSNEQKRYIKKFQKGFLELSRDGEAYREALAQWIDFCKYFLSKYPKTILFQYQFKETALYKSIDDFYKDVDICSYQLDLKTRVAKESLDQLVKSGKVYLFEIRNQDSNSGKIEGHKNNLHTMYWRAIFEDIANKPILNGGAHIFFVKALPVSKLDKICVKDKQDVIKHYRFSKEKFIFHVPITLNFCLGKGHTKAVNSFVNEQFTPYENTYFLGIDRGEKHLAYYSLVDRIGKVIEQGTLNMPFLDKNGNPYSIKTKKRFLDKDGSEQEKDVECKDYSDLLGARAGDRDYARKNWQTIGTIKSLKEGYISQVVHRITELVTRQLTFVVLEDLDAGFMRGRQKVEKSIYKKFEVDLVKKLSFIVDKSKDRKYSEVGSVTRAVQFTPLVKNYEELRETGKQAGIMLFVRPDYTSQTDPVTGWRKKIYIGKGSEDSIRGRIINSFDDIYFDGKDYVFSYIDQETGKEWKLYSGRNGTGLERFHRERGDQGEWRSVSQDLPEMLNGLFTDFDIETSLLEQIRKGGKPVKINEHTAWESLRFVIHLIQQIRNTGEIKDERNADFLLSPVRDESGNHFDSRIYWDKEQVGEYVGLPSSGDSNGAYNIARKGIILGEHIKRGFKLYIRDTEWDAWLAGVNTWEKWLRNNEDLLVSKKQKK